MWYEKFDASRRAERDSLSEKRQLEAASKNAIKEWTWEEDEILIARRLQQEERNALSKKLAREKLERIQHASKSLGISAPIVMTDFSYMHITYFFELLSLRPRNAKEVEKLDNVKMLKFGDPNINSTTMKNKSDEEILDEEERLSYVLEEDSFTRFILDDEQNKYSVPLPDAVAKKRKERPPQVVKTANGIRVEDLSSAETCSELLKLYRRYLVAESLPLDIWKEEDMGFVTTTTTSSSSSATTTTSNHQNNNTISSQQQQQQQIPYPLLSKIKRKETSVKSLRDFINCCWKMIEIFIPWMKMR